MDIERPLPRNGTAILSWLIAEAMSLGEGKDSEAAKDETVEMLMSVNERALKNSCELALQIAETVLAIARERGFR